MPADRGGPFDLFISYSHADLEVVASLDVALRIAGLRVFLDRRDILPGDALVTAVFDAISSAEAQVVVLSASSVESRWVRDELAAGRSRSLSGDYRVIPIVIDDCEVPSPLAHLKYLELREWRSDVVFRRGVAELLRALGRSPAAPSDATSTWLLTHASHVLGLYADACYALGYLQGGEAEGYGNTQNPGMALKWLLNDTSFGASILRERHADGELPYPRFSTGLLATIDWLTAADAPADGAPAVLKNAVQECYAYLDSLGVGIHHVSSWQATKASELSLRVATIRAALQTLSSDLARLALPHPAGA